MDKNIISSWCPKCNTMKDITKNKPILKKNIEPETIEDNMEIYNKLIDDILKEKKLDSEEYNNIKLDVLTKTKKYKNLKKEDKEVIVKKTSAIIKEIDETILAYFTCSTCGWYQEIPKQTKILTKNKGDINNKHVNLDRYKNMIYCPYVGLTRGYICVNDKCKSHKDHSKREAVFFRDIIDSTRTIMVCKECQSPWIVT